MTFGLEQESKSSGLSKLLFIFTIVSCLIVPTMLVGQSLQNYVYTPWGTTWATYWYPADNGLGAETDSGSCIGSTPAVIKNKFAYSSGVSEDISLERIRLLTDGKGNWIPSTASFSGNTSLFPTDGSMSLFLSPTYGGQSQYSMAVSSSGQLTVTETGTNNLSPNIFYYVTGGTITWSSKENINLNTGEDTWQFEARASGTGTKNCEFAGDLVASVHFFITVSLSPAASPPEILSFTNPAATSVGQVLPLPATVDPSSVASAPPAAALSADGRSAAAVVYESSSADPVTFSLSTTSSITNSKDIGTLTAFQPTFLSSPSAGSSINGKGQRPINAGCGGTGPTCIFLGLLWAPSNMPNSPSASDPLSPQPVTLVVNAAQDSSTQSASIILQTPPVILVHGVWSNATAAWSSFKPWLRTHDPNGQLVFTADYGKYSALTFENTQTQQILALAISDALNYAAAEDTVATTVDVVGHSMGGLVTRYFMDNGAPAPFAGGFMPQNVVHKLITIGTPHNGSALATALITNEATFVDSGAVLDKTICLRFNISCTAGNLFTALGKPIGSAVQSLESGYSSSQSYSGIEGLRPATSPTWSLLTSIIGGFLPGQTVDSILGGNSLNDTIVPAPSQIPGAADTSVIQNVVHTSIAFDTGETQSVPVFNQALYWLTGGAGQFSGVGFNALRASDHQSAGAASASTAPNPIFDLDQYTEVSSSNVTITPVSGTTLIIGANVNITATSATKILSQLLLYQNVGDPSDGVAYYATQTPYVVPFTPSRLGTTTFLAVAIFSDNTFAEMPLSYQFAPSGNAVSLSMTAPTTVLPVGLTTIVPVQALLPNGYLDVSTAASYSVRSGGTAVFTVVSGGAITTTGSGADWLDVSYDGLTTSAEISVGATEQTTATPVFSPPGGSYAASEMVAISDSTAGATIYYTTDGSTPTTTSSQYKSPLTVSTTETINAVAVASGYAASPVAQAIYTINLPITAIPSFTPASGIYTSLQMVAISDSTAGATIYYTTDGSTPTTTSSQYKSPLTVSTTETINAVAVASGYAASPVAQAVYTINLPQDFAMQLSESTLSLIPGQSGNLTLTVNPVNGFDKTITFVCSGLPVGTSCSFSPSTLTLNGVASTISTVTISSALTAASFGRADSSEYACLCGVAGVVFLFFRRRSWNKRCKGPWLLAVVAICATIGGCNQKLSTQIQTSTVSIYAISGTITHTAVLSLSVE
jgi:pimeloyl-ACP methyl ester carboxylesterase